MTGTEWHRGVLDLIDLLMELDPTTDSPEGRLLVRLADAAQSYEREIYYIAPPTAEEAASFRAEQAPKP